MFTPFGHLTYCTNIHSGESWSDHFIALKDHFPKIKNEFSPDRPMGIGLRLSNQASLELKKEENLTEFWKWLKLNGGYVFTLNGFPYGGFHGQPVKDRVHKPDWTTEERTSYTIRLFQILGALLPEGMDGGISTSPLSYKHWFRNSTQLEEAKTKATQGILSVILKLIEVKKTTGKDFHLDLEPEPDGLIESGREFIDWLENEVLTVGIPLVREKFKVTEREAEEKIKNHLRLCYDVCHFAVGYESHEEMLKELKEKQIKIGKIQISAALKAERVRSTPEIAMIKSKFKSFDEPVYLHQVIARKTDGTLLRYPDLPVALSDDITDFIEWRAHFHVPIFIEDIDEILSTTQDEIKNVLEIQKTHPFTQHLEVETYTWEVLPESLKLPIEKSIMRELRWVKNFLDQ